MRALALLACLPCGVAVAQPRATIELLPEVQVQAASVVLGHVAHLRSADLALMRKLVTLPIGQAPRAGQPASVQRAVLAQWVERAVDLGAGDLEWRGAERARVTRAARDVRGEDIAAVAAQSLREWLAAQGLQAQLQPRPLPRDLEAPTGEVRLQARPLAHAALRDRMLVWVELSIDGAFVRAVPVGFEVTATRPPLGRDGAAGPLETAPATAQSGVQAVLVARGDWATLRSAAGAVTLESRVEVLQDGRAGERVRVRQPGATGVVFARVVGASQLELAP